MNGPLLAQSSPPDGNNLPKTNVFTTYSERNQSHQDDSLYEDDGEDPNLSSSRRPKLWKAPALRAPVLLLTIAICWSLIAVLQYLLMKSQREQGIIFAPRINDLPLSRTFLYSYFPTIVAVVFSMFWAWIDLETKRIEPYYQLSKENGAFGKDSLLLHYPFDFLPLVPLKSFRKRHWPVFWASFAVVLVAWGLVPIQAGIFSVRSISRIAKLPFERSTTFIPADKQASSLTLGFTQTAYNVAVYNETVTAYMARNYTLAPFRPTADTSGRFLTNSTWSAPTTMYSLDLNCEPAVLDYRSGTLAFSNSSNGCHFDMGLNGNLTTGEIPDFTVEKLPKEAIFTPKGYSAMFVGYWNEYGLADFSLDEVCPTTSNSTFYAAFQRNKDKVTDPLQNVTAIYCNSTYYQQPVLATISTIGFQPIKLDLLGSKEALPDNLFNATYFEQLLTEEFSPLEVRGDVLPADHAPHYYDTVLRANVSLGVGPSGADLIEGLAGLALAVSNRPLDDYLDWKILSKSYADAYRLMFASAMKDILDQEFSATDDIAGQIQSTGEAVMLEPVFVYLVEGLLGIVSLATIALLYLSLSRKKNLRSNPSSIAAVMAMVADSLPLLSDIEDLNCSTVKQMENHLGHKKYKLIDNGSAISIVEFDSQVPSTTTRCKHTITEIANPVRPIEFSLWVALPVIGLFIILATSLGVLFIKARAQGLPPPSSKVIVQNILENYIPTAIATLIEPMWVLINRLLCLLQPIEELQSCKAKAKQSIDLNYSSLPPQLVIFKALRLKHFVLAAVCAMALLANLLAIAFAGLFNQATVDVQYSTSLSLPLDFKFVNINGTVGPSDKGTIQDLVSSGAYQGGDGQDQFFIADSYLRQGSPLPAWTGETMFYLPFSSDVANMTADAQFKAKTRAFGAKLECTSLEFGAGFQAGFTKNTSLPFVEIAVTTDTGINAQCDKTLSALLVGSRNALQTSQEGTKCLTGPSAAELSFVLDSKENVTQEESDMCMGSVVLGWFRIPNGTCDGQDTPVLNEQNAVFVHCRPKLVAGFATIQVARDGRKKRPVIDFERDDILDKASESVFSSAPINLIGQSNMYLFHDIYHEWHNDTFNGGNAMHYFTRHLANSTRLIDPTKSLPRFDDIDGPLNKAYSLLFAIWIGTFKERLLIPHPAGNLPELNGQRIVPERRLFLSTPMFVIAEGILGMYILAAILVYIRRPGRYLATMPTSIASLVALFAASTAVMDMRGTSYLNEKRRAKHLEKIDAQYGYGSFIGGSNGRVHIGIEKSPFVRMRTKSTWFEKVNSFRSSPMD